MHVMWGTFVGRHGERYFLNLTVLVALERKTGKKPGPSDEYTVVTMQGGGTFQVQSTPEQIIGILMQQVRELNAAAQEAQKPGKPLFLPNLREIRA